MTTTQEYPQTLLTGPAETVQIPRWIVSFSPNVANEGEVMKLTRLPQLTVVRAGTPRRVLAHAGFLSSLALCLSKTPMPAKILFVFDRANRPIAATEMINVLAFFEESGERMADVEFARGGDEAAFALQEAVAKIFALRGRSSVGEAEDPLGKLESVISATADLRGDSGKLSAQKAATVFGLSVAELARLIGRGRQGVTKTPEANSLQPLLAPFERVARLKTRLSQGAFRSFLNMANEQLDDRTPLEVIRSGRVEVVADLVEDMLTGSPT
jgi:hypothetical protein